MKHGANIYKYAKELKCSPDEILDFSSNINSYQPKIDITLTQQMLARYSDSSYKDLKKSISTKYNIKRSQIALYNGATSAIYELFKSLASKRVYLYAPLYGEYEKAVPSKSEIIKINRFKKIDTKIKKGSTIVFVNPSTPDGKYYDLKKLFIYWMQQNCTIIIDESFLEFENLDSLRSQINNYKKLYIIQSFSKFYSCAGVRIGAIFSHKKNIKKLQAPLWNLSSFDAAFLRQRLLDASFDKRSKNLHKMHKKEFLLILENTGLFSKIYASDSNFILVKSKHAKEIFKHLLEHKILLRTCGSFDFLSDEYLRFGVKDVYKHDRLKKAFQDLILNEYKNIPIIVIE
ncbi:MAG: aminotransferase class I/II-fold pyridoxal phosphate-dependent enzyme [Sulfurimonas sp.]|nr:aminotransferase class I/II-fold pyridoxal phosphate-dependent enzyme [Sulfurimonas sp.]